MYTVAMIGAGAISANHLAAVAQHPDTQLIAVADLDLGRAQQAAAPFGAASYSDYREMLRQETPALVIVSLPHALHEECVLACAEAGAHILLEKMPFPDMMACRGGIFLFFSLQRNLNLLFF